MLTQGCAPQDGDTPLFTAAHQGHLEVVQVLVQAHANKDAPNKVSQGSGGDVERTDGVCVGFLAGGCSNVAD